MSSEDKVKYVTFKMSKDLAKVFQEFLSDIGVSRDKRKNLFKSHHVYTRGGVKPGDYKETLQVISNKNKTINVEIFTGNSVIIMAIHHMGYDALIGNALNKHFDFKSL